MKNLIISLFGLCLLFPSCQQTPKSISLKGSIDDIESGMAKIINISNAENRAEILDSAKIIDYKFELDLENIPERLPVSISLKNAEGTKSTSGLFLTSKSNTTCEVKNGQFLFGGNEVQDTFNSITNAFMDKVQQFQKYAASDPDSLKIVSNELYSLTLDLLNRHGESEYGLFAYSLATNYLMMKFGDSYYSKFGQFCNEKTDLNKNVWKYNFCRQVEMMSKLKDGNTLDPDFSLKDRNNELVDLSNFKNKVILFDFWAYWCGPCVKDIPHLKLLYEKYKPLGFEIISVSTDLREGPWQKALIKYDTPWTQLMDSQNQEQSLSMKLNVGPIPRYILLDSNHKIVNFDIDSKDLDLEISKVLKQ